MQRKNSRHSQTLNYFKEKLLELRRSIIEDAYKMLRNFQEEISLEEQSSEPWREMHWITECCLLTREQEMLNMVDSALQRIENKTYEDFEDMGELISFSCLEVYPLTTFVPEAQQERERYRRTSYVTRQKIWR